MATNDYESPGMGLGGSQQRRIRMDTMTAFAMGQASRDKERMVFDWGKAAKIIKERNATTAAAGLAGDWEYTGGYILKDGKPIPEEETYVFLSSTWARPELEVDGNVVDCYRMESETPGWNESTYWPESALRILGAT